MNCKCLAKMQSLLNERAMNTVIDYAMNFRGQFQGIALRTYPREKGRGKKKPATVLASYCPFCGKKYEIVKETNAKKIARHERIPTSIELKSEV